MRTRLVCAVGSWALIASASLAADRQLYRAGKTLTATKTDKVVEVDGILDDAVWKNSTPYHLTSCGRTDDIDDLLYEDGTVQFAWDDTYFYIAIRFDDRDIVSQGKQDQMHHYKLGDVVEVFLKPETQSWCWELYATPCGKKTSFLHSKGREMSVRNCGLRVAAQHTGTLNSSEDVDTSWTAEMAAPIQDLVPPGQHLEQGSRWRVLVGRYNYTWDLAGPALSATPHLDRANFHDYEEYGILELVR